MINKALPIYMALAILLWSSGCKTFEYEPDNVVISDENIYVSNVGFKGYTLKIPPGYLLVSEEEIQRELVRYKWVESFRGGYRNSEGLNYHFHRDFVFRKGAQIIFFIPFHDKNIRQFRHTPPDILEKQLKNWARWAEFSKIINLDLAWSTESDERGHSTVILKSKVPKNGSVYEEHLMSGDLNEIFIFAGFAAEGNAAALTEALNQFRESLEVIR
ncbi:MAG: hypothetical protein ACSHYA_11705 [Opitutaceae bacterium]